MAKQSKATGAGTGGRKKKGDAEPKRNTFTAEEAGEYFDELHALMDRGEEERGKVAGEINAVYDRAVTELNVKKSVVKHLFAKERRKMKDEKKEAKMDKREAEDLERFAAAFGDDTPMGQWAKEAAGRAGTETSSRKKEAA